MHSCDRHLLYSHAFVTPRTQLAVAGSGIIALDAMRHRASAVVRWLIASLLAVSLLAVSAAAFAPAHLHGGVKSDACAVCKASEIPIVATKTSAAVRLPAPVAEYLHDSSPEAPLERETGAIRPRAPPAL